MSILNDTTPHTTADPIGAPRRPRRWRYAARAAVIVGLVAVVVVLTRVGYDRQVRWGLIVLSTAAAASSAIPSIRAVRADPASLQPVTWGIWTLLTGLAAAASALSADWAAVIFSLIGTATCATITVVVLRVGMHVFTRRDAICLTLGIAGLVGWQTLHQPQLAILAACAGDLAALTPTIVHAWQRPTEEPTASFALIATSGLLTAAAAWGHWTITALGYPLYVAASTATVAAITLRTPTRRS